MVLALLVVLLVLALVRGLLVEVFAIPSESMQPTLEPGDRIAVWRPGAQDVRRGQLVVFDGRGSLAPYDPHANPLTDSLATAASWVGLRTQDHVYVKRAVGIGGDIVACCSAAGRLEVNGRELEEPYLPAGEKASTTRFSVTVPEGTIWVMGDHRSKSADSRNLLAAPGGGMVPVDQVIGRPVRIIWPLDRAGGIVPANPDGHR